MRAFLELLRVRVRCDANGGELLVIKLIGGTCFYTMRRGLSEGYDGCECSGYDYRTTDK
jgi:hypothetical protein